jgi:hypothetical protein
LRGSQLESKGNALRAAVNVNSFSTFSYFISGANGLFRGESATESGADSEAIGREIGVAVLYSEFSQ